MTSSNLSKVGVVLGLLFVCQGLNASDLTANNAALTRTVTLKTPTDFPILGDGGKQVGKITLPAGSQLPLVNVTGDEATVSVGGGNHQVKVASLDLSPANDTAAPTQVAQIKAAPSAPSTLTVDEGFINPVGFHDPLPNFSWKLPAGTKAQKSYQIELTAGGATLWDSGWTVSDQSSHVPYKGPALNSRQQAQWRVRFRDDQGIESPWSEPARLEMGLLTPADWKARWISPSGNFPADREAVTLLRRSFPVSKPIAEARLYVTARGLFEASLNGKKVGQDKLTPGWTPYQKRLDTLTYDVTDRIVQGNNDLGVLLGTGWYVGRLGYERKRAFYGKTPELLLQLEIRYKDGTTETIASDSQWEGTIDGPILLSSLYDGEDYDARKQPAGWAPVAVNADLGPQRLLPKPALPVRQIKTLTTQAITQPSPGTYVFDLGQNMVGVARIRIPVKKDQTVKLRFAEMLQTNGTLYTENYRSARSTDSYTPDRDGTIEWEPHFTFHGFRYVELSGLPAGVTPQKDWVTGIVLSADMKKTGLFESSHPKLNQLQSNITWGQISNFIDIPTDCPQRDERLGWTGDAHVFCETSMFNYDSHAFWKSWLESIRDEQRPDGSIPDVVPTVVSYKQSPGWMDVGPVIAWESYVRSGDRKVLEENFSMMEKQLGWYRAHSKEGLTPDVKGWGDWLQPYPTNPKNQNGDTPHDLLGAAFYARDARILASAAKALGKENEAKSYTAEADTVRDAFAKHFFDAEGKLQNAPETQTGYVLAIAFNLLPPDLKKKAGDRLAKLVADADNHLRTGFLGTPFIAVALDDSGHSDLATKLLFQETYPSWFYPINQGATTMWERWNSYTKESGFGSAGMNSFNHYAYGAIGQWLYERIAGLTPDPEQPGYKHFFVRPLVIPELTSARAELETSYGKAGVAWASKAGRVSLDVIVPPNTTATLLYPQGSEPRILSAGTHHFDF
jgi:alpha-L-rhamnosidase